MMEEKFSEMKKNNFACFFVLEKAFDRLQREWWRVFDTYQINGLLLKVIKVFYKNRATCVRFETEKENWFEVGVGLRQGCVMSPWWFDIFIDNVVRDMDRIGNRMLK